MARYRPFSDTDTLSHADWTFIAVVVLIVLSATAIGGALAYRRNDSDGFAAARGSLIGSALADLPAPLLLLEWIAREGLRNFSGVSPSSQQAYATSWIALGWVVVGPACFLVARSLRPPGPLAPRHRKLMGQCVLVWLVSCWLGVLLAGLV